MEIYVKYWHLYFEFTTTSCKFVYISIFEVIMAGRDKVALNFARNLIKQHLKISKSIRTIRKLVKESHSTVLAIIKWWKLLELELLKMHWNQDLLSSQLSEIEGLSCITLRKIQDLHREKKIYLLHLERISKHFLNPLPINIDF